MKRPPIIAIAVTATVVVIAGSIAIGLTAMARTDGAAPLPTDAVKSTLPGLVAASGAPELDSIRLLHPKPGELLRAAGPFDDRFALDGLTFDGASASGALRVTSDVSAVLDLEIIAGFYDAGGSLIGSARFVYHSPDDGPVDPVTGTPVESIPFRVAVPTEFAGRAVSASLGVPVLVNE
ncbi:hypothetical protein F1C58_03465 [Glaciihabitans sp. INWT7]|uniref:hypothetical protein n=1 Tax=Glaciihabitans sp. INWT7 TaxID=2596912 RepID=UPI0016234287|nr:hypothetical protein [Glaciihabitans sp. INWT7]QNE46060.1 hypothetical protein F1C58_03465 [Glaciihabitans sp. INWT7]